MRWPWQTREDGVIHAIDRALDDAKRVREEHDAALKRLRDALPKDEDDDRT